MIKPVRLGDQSTQKFMKKCLLYSKLYFFSYNLIINHIVFIFLTNVGERHERANALARLFDHTQWKDKGKNPYADKKSEAWL